MSQIDQILKELGEMKALVVQIHTNQLNDKEVINSIKETVWGANGEPGHGTRIDRIEQAQISRTKALAAGFSVLGLVGIKTIVDLFRSMFGNHNN